jgi:hypothetical protein
MNLTKEIVERYLGLTSLKITVLDTGHQDEESRTGKHFIYSCGGTGGPTRYLDIDIGVP